MPPLEPCLGMSSSKCSFCHSTVFPLKVNTHPHLLSRDCAGPCLNLTVHQPQTFWQKSCEATKRCFSHDQTNSSPSPSFCFYSLFCYNTSASPIPLNLIRRAFHEYYSEGLLLQLDDFPNHWCPPAHPRITGNYRQWQASDHRFLQLSLERQYGTFRFNVPDLSQYKRESSFEGGS